MPRPVSVDDRGAVDVAQGVGLAVAHAGRDPAWPPLSERCVNAVRCADPFHIVRWATEALGAVRRDAWNTARRAPGGSWYVGAAHGRPPHQARGYAKELKNARWALWKNPRT